MTFHLPFSEPPRHRLRLQYAWPLAFGFLSVGCGIKGSGVLVDEERSLAQFDTIVMSDGFSGRIVPGDDYLVRLIADDNLIDLIEVEVQGERLKIDLGDRRTRDATLEVEFVMPGLLQAELEDGCKLEGREVPVFEALKLGARDGSRIALSVAPEQVLESVNLLALDDSTIHLEAESEQTFADVDNGSSVKLEGATEMFDLTVADGSSLQAEDFIAQRVDCSIGDGSSASIWASVSIEGFVNDGSTLELWGEAEEDLDVRDGSSVSRH